jgi:(1->4)-alpha-D-glucan 1-alpha-D-glucosylmutase
LLQARQTYADVFTYGNYQPLTVSGKFADRIIAFARCSQNTTAITIAPRFLATLIEPSQLPLATEIWQDTQIELPQGIGSTWENMITAEIGMCNSRLLVGEAFQHFPGALLISQG